MQAREDRSIHSSPPTPEFIRGVLARVEMQLTAGHWLLAERTIAAAANDWNEYLLDQANLPADLLQRPLVQTEIPYRIANAFEEVGCFTFGEALARIESGGRLPRCVGTRTISMIKAMARAALTR